MNDELPPAVATIRDLAHAYGKVCALDGISLSIPAGCMAGLIGPDGVGKSTLLSLIAGVRQLQTGDLRVLDADLRSASDRRTLCPRIAYMPQGLGGNLYPTLSVRENIDFFARLFGQSKAERSERIVELLEATGLETFSERPAAKLSGGMKQKLGLCCALIHDPELLILDEPTTGVDPLSRRQFWDLIDRIRERSSKMSVLVATAYMEEAERFSWLAMVDEGRIIAKGAPDDLRSQTGTNTLEEAYVSLLPEEKRRGHHELSIPPFQSQDGMPAIETRGLTKSFGDFTAVDDVSIRIERGEIFGFIGSNGCGKTTTMKMLTGLLPASKGEALLFGNPVNAHDLATRRRVGYMSQSFSLYGELTVRQNLELHARLFDLPPAKLQDRIDALTTRFRLQDYESAVAAGLPLGIRQRLSLAVAVIHDPEVLILDEPTSGVDPIERDGFWELLSELSRQQFVTIFISTHFMNEAARCDRIALMHAGRILDCQRPNDLVEAHQAASLEDAFVSILMEASASKTDGSEQVDGPLRKRSLSGAIATSGFRVGRLLAYAARESLELRRDPIRLGFALLGPMLLMVVLGFGISLDIEDISYSALDQDQTPQSRQYLENFEGSRYFDRAPPVHSLLEHEHQLQLERIKLGVEIPPHFARDLKRGRKPQIAFRIDGALPFRGETIRGYAKGIHERYLGELDDLGIIDLPSYPFKIATRFKYNQEFRSTYAIVPGILAVLMILIPAILTALGVVREKELGSITNFYATPTTRIEFLLGKQLPYAALGLVSFLGLIGLATTLFGIPLKGSLPALLSAALLYTVATTGFGLLVSSFVRSQVAALVVTTVLTMTPSINFSGLLVPVSSLTGGSFVMGHIYPSMYFLKTTVGTFTKGLGFTELYPNHLILVGFILIYWAASAAFLKKQEK